MRDRRSLLGVERDVERLRPNLLEDVTRERPRLRIVREVDIVPQPWWDSPAFGMAIVVSLLAGVVLIALAMGWIR
jgi:hypothetical protein